MRTPRGKGKASIRIGRVLAATVVALVLGIGVALLLQIRRYQGLRKDLAAARQELAEQKVLHPLYRELVKTLGSPPAAARPRVTEQPLGRTDIVGVPDRLSKAATACGLTLGSVNPRIGETGKDARHLSVDVQVSGAYGRLRDFLQVLSEWPSFIRIQEVEVKQKQETEEFHLCVWLALD